MGQIEAYEKNGAEKPWFVEGEDKNIKKNNTKPKTFLKVNSYKI
jgi:hypothetical protein